jgi:LysR family transcriptional regulator, low CO2-responsive transcriptional regulator
MALDMRIQLSKLAIYCRVVELESVTKAAKELSLSQPVVTSHVRTLRTRLGAELLYREGHSMRTTEAGELAYGWAKDVLTRSHEMSRRIEGLADDSRGNVAIAAGMTVGSYILPPVLSGFQEERPLARIGLDMLDPDHVVAGVEAGAYDFGVLIADGNLLEGSLVFEQVGEDEFVLVAGPSANLPDAVSPAELAKIQQVAPPAHRVREQLLSRLLTAKGIERGPRVIELGHAEAMKQVVKESDAVAFLFGASVRDELARGDLRRVRVRGIGRLPAPIYLAYRSTKNFSALQHALIGRIRENLG